MPDHSKMPDQFQNKTNKELIDLILKLEQEKNNLLSKNSTYRSQIDELEDAIDNSKKPKIEKPTVPSTSSRNNSTESSKHEKLKNTSLEKLKITKLEQEKQDFTEKLDKQKKLSDKYVSDKVKLCNQIDDLKKKVTKLESAIQTHRQTKSDLNNEMSLMQQQQLAIVKNIVQAKLEEYFGLNKGSSKD